MTSRSAFLDPGAFAFVPGLEAASAAIVAELQALGDEDFVASPDSLTAVDGTYDETGWRWFGLFAVERAGDPLLAANAARCPATMRALRQVPGLVNAGFSLFRPGTHLYPHRGELPSVLRCHLPLLVPGGNVGLRFGDEIRRWQPGRCLVFDDMHEHEAWNHGDGDRVVLIVTFQRPDR